MFDLNTLSDDALIALAKKRALKGKISPEDLSASPNYWSDSVLLRLLLDRIKRQDNALVKAAREVMVTGRGSDTFLNQADGLIQGVLNQELLDGAKPPATPRAKRPAVKTFPGIVQAKVLGSHRTGELPETLKASTISKVLGFKSKGPSGDGKCRYQWNFSLLGKEAAIWDYKGSRWSVYDPHGIVDMIFAEAMAIERRR